MISLPHLIAGLVGRAAAVFYRVDRLGPTLPPGPVLVVANHPNALLDPLVIFRTAGRPTRPLAKAPLFERPVIGLMLRGLGGLPVYRQQDDPTQMHRNEHTFDAAVAALRAGDAIQIYPEGRSHSEPGLVELRTGAARIALRAEAEAGWRLGLRIVPVGLTYTRKAFFRGRVAAAIGEPFDVAPFREQYAVDPAAAVRTLTDRIADALEAVILNLSADEDRDLIETAEKLYAREKGLAAWREREGLGERLPRLQRFAQGLAWLRAHDPDRHARLARMVRRYSRLAGRLGAGEGDVPARYEAGGVARYATRELLLLALGLPFAAAGLAFWYLPYLAPRLVVRVVRPEHEAIATYKLGAALVALPLAYALGVAAAWLLAGGRGALAAAVLLPPLGFAALRWVEKARQALEDARLFVRAQARPRSRGRLAAWRAALVAEIDAIAAEAGVPAGGAAD